jgi:hypothetical protein
LALWNTLPNVEKRRRVGVREALINELWSAIENVDRPRTATRPKAPSKQDVVIAMLRQPDGATVDEVTSVTGWQRHTVRPVLGNLEKKPRLTLTSAQEERGRVYRIVEGAHNGGCPAPGVEFKQREGNPMESRLIMLPRHHRTARLRNWR